MNWLLFRGHSLVFGEVYFFLNVFDTTAGSEFESSSRAYEKILDGHLLLFSGGSVMKLVAIGMVTLFGG